MKIYTIIGGVNGVGKSSLSGVLSAENNDLGVLINTDKITADMGGDKIEGGKAAIRQIEKCLDMGISFTQETTLSGVRVLKTVKRAVSSDYYIRLYYVGVDSAEESIRRIKNRVAKGGHDIPDDDVRRRFAKRFDDLMMILPYCNEAHFFDNENGFSESAEYKNGTLIVKTADIPDWVKKLKEMLDISSYKY